ncbi:MAG: hypothetical protein CR967_04240 [Proteobacteria bacterium]|nr:MAG: hypothetical protein CR967_04240 [Pseudomonadota bacterium]
MDELKNTLEPTPKPKTFLCKLISYLIVALLYGLPFIFGIIGYVKYDLFIGFCLLCFGYLLNGIIHSKLRLLSIPPDQREISFSSHEIARWFVSRYLICK